MAAEAGIPTRGTLINDRSEDSVSKILALFKAHSKVLLKPKNPLSRIPRIKSVRPTKNWLPFPTDGSKGLPKALSQTWCNGDSISFEVWRKR
jgi:hypothetical protein